MPEKVRLRATPLSGAGDLLCGPPHGHGEYQVSVAIDGGICGPGGEGGRYRLDRERAEVAGRGPARDRARDDEGGEAEAHAAVTTARPRSFRPSSALRGRERRSRFVAVREGRARRSRVDLDDLRLQRTEDPEQLVLLGLADAELVH